MKGPSVQERALLAAVLKEALAKQDVYSLLSSASARSAREDMAHTLRTLETDNQVKESKTSTKEVESASIMGLCKTLCAVAVEGVEKPRVCMELREYLDTLDECTCLVGSMALKSVASKALVPKGMLFLGNFKDTYGGLALAKRFFEHCSSNWRTKGCQYAPSCAVVQSSGSGKSRLMVQIGQSVPMFYVCARHPGDTGHPPRTPLIVDHLLFSGRAASDDEIYSRCAAFYCVASLYARTMWKAVASTEEAVKHSLGGFLDQQLYEAFWKRFIAEMETIEAKVRAEVATVDSSHAYQTRWQLVEDRAHDVTAEYLHSDVFHNEGLSFVVCLDEAGNLGPRRGKSHPFDLLTQLHRASRLMSEKLGGVLVMLDTLCCVPAFGQRENFPSARMRQFGVESRVFSNLLTYNLWPHAPRPMQEIVKLDSLAEYGRPLWMSYRGVRPIGEYMILDLAAAKITGRVQLSEADLGSTKQLGVALFAARVHLQIVSYTKLSAELVGHFMAHLDDVDSVGNSHVGYPSDPILALGAAKVLASKRQYIRSLENLALFLRSEYVQAGFRGELVVQLLMLRAYDELAFKAGVYQERPVQVGAFLKKLLGEGYKSLQDLKLITKQNQEVLEGSINLTHFVQVNYLPNRADLVEFLSRGAGIICNRGQEAIDLIVPVLLEKEFREGNPARTKTAGPCHIDKIRYRKRTASSTGLSDASPDLRAVVEEISGKIKALGPPKATFVSSESVERRLGAGALDEERAKEKAEEKEQKKDSPSLTSIPNPHNISYVIIQCKNWMGEKHRAHPVLQVVSPLEEASEASNDSKKRKTGESEKPSATARPYVFIGAYFTQLERAEVYRIKHAQAPPRNCLPFACLNGHLFIKGDAGAEALAQKIGSLLEEFSDPAYLREEDAEWNMLQNHPRYGTEVDWERHQLALSAVEADHGDEDEADEIAGETDPRRVAAALLRDSSWQSPSTGAVYHVTASGGSTDLEPHSMASTSRRSGRLAEKQP